MMQERRFDLAGGVAVRPEIGVRRLLEWAFADECARLDFDEEAGRADQRLAVDPVWRMMRQAELGCRVDGGPVPGAAAVRADDAEIIAAVVARLPVARGGKAMAVRVVELARARSAPDWMPGAQPRLVPVERRQTKHGAFAATEVCGHDVVPGRRGRMVRHDRRVCPVRVVPTPAQIAAARRAYLDWWGALWHIAHDLRGAGLSRWRIGPVMPVMEPWKVGA